MNPNAIPFPVFVLLAFGLVAVTVGLIVYSPRVNRWAEWVGDLVDGSGHE